MDTVAAAAVAWPPCLLLIHKFVTKSVLCNERPYIYSIFTWTCGDSAPCTRSGGGRVLLLLVLYTQGSHIPQGAGCGGIAVARSDPRSRSGSRHRARRPGPGPCSTVPPWGSAGAVSGRAPMRPKYLEFALCCQQPAAHRARQCVLTPTTATPNESRVTQLLPVRAYVPYS
jgi:hypothetical protein